MSMFDDIAERKMMENSDYAKWVYEIKKNLANRKHYDPVLVDQIMQVHGKFGFSNYDIFYFMNVYTGILKGDILATGIYIGETPEGDKDIQENNKKLKQLPVEYAADFINSTGAGYNDDGKFEWKKPISFKELAMSDNGEVYVVKEHTINPRRIALEVGFTKPERTYEHINSHGGVARWAYGHKHIHIFINKDNMLMFRGEPNE